MKNRVTLNTMHLKPSSTQNFGGSIPDEEMRIPPHMVIHEIDEDHDEEFPIPS